MSRPAWILEVALAAVAIAPFTAPVVAQGHGPIYGLSTPTLGQGDWSLDVGAMGRLSEGDGRTTMVRPMLSYGITEDLQVFVSVPLALERDRGVPPFRAFTRMPANRDVEVGLGWRLQRNDLGVGARRETTLWVAAEGPLDNARGGVPARPGAFAALVTGYASRSLYLWAGGAHRRYLGEDGTRPGDSTMASLVIGYRPGFLRTEYPGADWRGFLELLSEWRGEDRVGGVDVAGSGGRQVLLGLTALGLYGSWGIAGGPAFPIAQDGPVELGREAVRLVLNLTFWW